MIKSMTGFGRCEYAKGERRFVVEMKGVNHRYLDVNIRMPKKLNFFETAIRNLLKQSVQRGKVDIFISYEDLSESQVALKYNETLAGEYLRYFHEMEESFGLENDIRVSTLSRCPEVLTMEEQAVDEEELWNELKQALDGAIRQFVETRGTEGENLKKDLIEKLDGMVKLADQIEERSPQILSEYRQKLETKVKELLADTQIEEGRIAAEVVMFADKICTDEEVVRLRSHILHMKETLQSDESGIGRKLDFIAQEMNREANTILSKANDLETSNIGIDLKTEIEKVREQIQNIDRGGEKELENKGILIVVSGFSGAGKGTIMRALLDKYEETYALSVSATTRDPRPGEVEGREYFFRTVEEFEKMIAKEDLIEYAKYVDNYYGTPRTYVEEQLERGRDVILEIEIQGALKVKEKFPETLLLFVTPPSAAELKRRLEGRGTETPEVIASRMKRAREEAEYMDRYDYLIINDDLNECVEEMHQIIQGEHRRSYRNNAFMEHKKEDLKGE